jgi:serine phosphatase RsbU (regulator of sigma subunit)
MESDFKANILLVDDQPANLLVLEALLESLGENTVKARSGPEALRCLLDQDFALILMDAQMPGMDGFETADLIHLRDRSKYTPIIFLTAYERTDAQMFKGYSLGAVDYLVKPIVPEVLRSKVSVFVQLFRMREQVKRQAAILREKERQEYERQLAEQRAQWEAERLQEQLRLAQEIQRRLFPGRPPMVPGYDIFGASEPAEITSGDYYDYLSGADGAVTVAVGDVCGHGLGPALLMAATRAYLRGFALTPSPVAEILKLTNRALVDDVADGRFVTLILGRLDPSAGTFSYASAGHHRGYLLNAAGNIKKVLESTGLPLGLARDADFQESPAMRLEPGDVVFLLTDGIVEARGQGVDSFGIQRALDVVASHRMRPAREIVGALYDNVSAFTDGHGHLDDITTVVIKAGAVTPSTN